MYMFIVVAVIYVINDINTGCSDKCHDTIIKLLGHFPRHSTQQHHHSRIVGLFCKLTAQEITLAVILCKYSLHSSHIKGAAKRAGHWSATRKQRKSTRRDGEEGGIYVNDGNAKREREKGHLLIWEKEGCRNADLNEWVNA